MPNLARADLIEKLIGEIRRLLADAPPNEALESFAQGVLRRVDDRYLYRHRLTTLSAQLIDSFAWIAAHAGSGEVAARAFRPVHKVHGYDLEGRVIETLMPDQPFIYDTLKLLMASLGVRVVNSLSIIFPVRIDGDGQVVAIEGAAGDDAGIYSYTRWYCDWPAGLSEAALADGVRGRLDLSRQVVADFNRMVRTINQLANDLDFLAKEMPDHEQSCLEVHDFLEWLVDQSFVVMGISFYRPDADGVTRVLADQGLGSARNNPQPSGAGTQWTLDSLANGDADAAIARVRKSPQDSLIHRRGKVDEILVRTHDNVGRPNGGVVIHGLFTFKALSQNGSSIPILRGKIERLVATAATVLGSYEHKSLVNAFNALPVEYLFEANESQIEELLHLSVRADETRAIQSRVVLHEETSSAYAFVVLPKEYYSDELRAELEEILLAELGASYADHRVYLGKFGSVALHFYLTGEGKRFGNADLVALEQRLEGLGTPWSVRLEERLEADYGQARGAALFQEYGPAFSEGYSDMTSPAEAVVDIQHLDHVVRSGKVRFDVFPSAGNADEVILRIYSQQELLLTDVMPVIDNFGVVCAEQIAWDMTPRSGPMFVNTLRLARGEHDVLAQRVRLIDGLRAVFGGLMLSTRLNRLMLPAKLSWQQVDLVRAYFGYAAQIGHGVPAERLMRVLLRHASFVSTLVALFVRRFDPDTNSNGDAREAQVQRVSAELYQYLDAVESSEEDRILRTVLNLVEATVRTNFFVRHRADGEHFISLKLRSADVLAMPDPRPLFEIYVHHVRLAGIHLRGGRVARGGLRWSDRLDDFRSEVLGLMATQMLKNTLIVPVGAKGGFVLRDRFSHHSTARAAADELYRIFIRALLEVTDNIVDAAVVTPERVVRYDGDDPYLVVAADKGTAHLSDTANSVAADFGFWLGDAFASGGSIGYDHKEYGITARGAWVCVQRHFRELGIDAEADPITAVGIGDMSGDVFGNGMLLSRSMKVVAAFNHRHVFIDPDPDPQRSWEERKRLFETPGTQWTDYDRSLISEGGGIYDRGAKAIALSPAAARILGTDSERLSGEETIRLILKADVDLLWNGGIGTYIKASTETHADVNDKDNDSVRVDARDVRAKVLGEGGNLGVTMRGRVEFALNGGRCYLDAIDNSGGVDMSDHEVNLKILIQVALRRGDVAAADRDELLRSLGEDIAERVLANNTSQSLAIALDELRSRQNIWQVARAQEHLRGALGFSRRVQRLPRGREVLEHREARSEGFMRPELAKLLSFSKQFAYSALVDAPVGTPDELLPYVESYFPVTIGERFQAALREHMLFTELAATVQVNRIVRTAGVTFFPRLLSSTSRSTSEVAATYLMVEELLQLDALRDALEGFGPEIPSETCYAALVEVENRAVASTQAVLELYPGKVSLALRGELKAVAALRDAIAADANRFLPPNALRRQAELVTGWVDLGLPVETAEAVANLSVGVRCFAAARLAADSGAPAEATAAAYFRVGHTLDIFALQERLGAQVHSDDWDRLATESIQRSLQRSVMKLTTTLAAGATPAEAVLTAAGDLGALGRQIGELLREPVPVSAAFVMSERLRQGVRSFIEASAQAAEG